MCRCRSAPSEAAARFIAASASRCGSYSVHMNPTLAGRSGQVRDNFVRRIAENEACYRRFRHPLIVAEIELHWRFQNRSSRPSARKEGPICELHHSRVPTRSLNSASRAAERDTGWMAIPLMAQKAEAAARADAAASSPGLSRHHRPGDDGLDRRPGLGRNSVPELAFLLARDAISRVRKGSAPIAPP
jgi:hypothetical protein